MATNLPTYLYYGEKKKPRERIAIPAVNLQNLKLVHIVAIAKKHTASAQKEARVRGTFV